VCRQTDLEAAALLITQALQQPAAERNVNSGVSLGVASRLLVFEQLQYQQLPDKELGHV
jgi:hypothetical protein